MLDTVRLAIIADTHLPRGTRTLPAECLRRLSVSDLILHAGDHCSVASLEELRALGPPVEAVHGNADEPELRSTLPRSHVVSVGGISIGMTHVAGDAAGREDRLISAFPTCAAIVYGHTHAPHVSRIGGVWILNPGSPTERRRSPVHSMIELTIERGRPIRPKLIPLP
jgi:putative phosphoesterase